MALTTLPRVLADRHLALLTREEARVATTLALLAPVTCVGCGEPVPLGWTLHAQALPQECSATISGSTHPGGLHFARGDDTTRAIDRVVNDVVGFEEWGHQEG